MKFLGKFGVIIIAAVVLIGLTGSGLYGIFGSGGSNYTEPTQLPNEDENAKVGLDVAREWIQSESPTYTFDGSNLDYIESVELNCYACYGYIFNFESAHAGYGDRSGEVLAQVITPHTLAIATKEGTVVQAVTDDTYDEIRRKFIPQIGDSETSQPE